MKNTILQTFEWYTPDDGKFWDKVARNAKSMEQAGYTMAWLPPAYKGQSGITDVGYGVYDLYDLGEFDQKGTVRTKYGTKDEYLNAIASLKKHNIKVISDIVLNHRMGADEKERVVVQKVDSGNRDSRQGNEYETEVWTRFTFPGRQNKYSDYQWNWESFKGTDYDASNNRQQIMLFKGKNWNQDVSSEQGNFDYIMGNDVDMDSDAVTKELYDWGKWYQETTDSDGYRLDAVKSIDFKFFEGWLKMMDETGNHEEPFAVGEYWTGDISQLKDYLDHCNFSMHLFDVPLHFKLQQISQANGGYDVRTLFGHTITTEFPDHTIPFVDNHDTQPDQALQSWVQDWFKPAAYASILLYKAKNACVFIGDVEGVPHSNNPRVPHLNEMVWIRKNLLSDDVVDLFDEDPAKACWIARGDHPVIVLYSIADHKEKQFQFDELKNKNFINIMNPDQKTGSDEWGNTRVYVDGGNCAVYITEEDYQALKEAMESVQL